MPRLNQLVVATLVALCAMSISGCAGRYLHGDLIQQDAKIRNKPENVEIIDLMRAYKQGLESLDTDRLRALVSPDYYENGGTTNTTDDDYGYQGLVDLFETLTKHVKQIRVSIKLREIRTYDDRADVVFEYAYTMLYNVSGNNRWQTDRDVNRFQLHREDGEWRIVSGL